MRLVCLSILLLFLASCASSRPSRDRRGLLDFGDAPRPSQAWSAEEDGTCSTISKEDRLKLLEIADPSNFPHTRYRKGPRRSVERETDCSHFVHEVYKRAGFFFGFRSSRDLKNAPEFTTVPEGEERPGDLMLFRGHVGIVDEEGRIISATKTRGRKRSSITRLDRTNFRPVRGAQPVLRYCKPANRRVAQQ